MNVVILGNGVAGITAARHIRKRSNHSILVVSEETDYFFSRTALMYVYMGHLRPQDLKPYEDWFWAKNRIQLLRARVTKVDFENKTLRTADGRSLTYDCLILATGSKSNKFGWPGQDLDGVQGLYHWQDLEAMERHSRGLKRAVVVGGGLIGIEMAEMFHSRGIPVTFLVRESSFWNNVLPAEESAMISRHILEHGIDLRLNTELREILPDAQGKCRAVITSHGEEISCGFVGLTVGVSPNVDFLRDTPLEIGLGIRVDEFLRTNIPDVYAIGDCAELRQPPPGRRPVEAMWYSARAMGETVARTICGEPTLYNPGIWFNSAKFFDIEYQTYGNIPPICPPEMETLFWAHPDGRKSIRINYDRITGTVVGFNLLGIRYRHALCDLWLRQGAHIETVLENLGAANFDPECYPAYEVEVVNLYNRRTGRALSLKQRRGLSWLRKAFHLASN
ncbi:MAG: NAD(P)/FAD-dependent oxidoreductase [Saprospiraceae bacterium]|nr:NAD(P)/FAD-dependent oxidoreductase [Saprospiraceae bacterium]MDW8483504.1 FAD/NAD(P)-binding oxidoreductase [Saprospiraceae bacterium]